MTTAKLHELYTGTELTTQKGNQEFRYNVLSPLFENLYENKVVYRERFTAIIELVDLELLPDRFMAKAKLSSIINRGFTYRNKTIPEKWKIEANWAYLKLIENYLTPYSCWVIWPDYDFVKSIEKLMQNNQVEEINTMLSH